jgi:hypothetical protein
MHPDKQPAEASRALLVQAIKSLLDSAHRVVELAEAALGASVGCATLGRSEPDSTKIEAAKVTSIHSKHTTSRAS